MFDLTFHPASEAPTEEGDYLLLNRCDGYHIAHAWRADGVMEFRFFAQGSVPDGFYCAWAKLPDSLHPLLRAFDTRKV